MAGILLFNIEGEKLRRIGAIAEDLGIACRSVEAKDQHKPLGELVGLVESFPKPERIEPFSEEMLVIYELDEQTFSALLHMLRRDGAAVALKAIVTEHNLLWSAAKLGRELAEEHARMAELLKARAGKE